MKKKKRKKKRKRKRKSDLSSDLETNSWCIFVSELAKFLADLNPPFFFSFVHSGANCSPFLITFPSNAAAISVTFTLEHSIEFLCAVDGDSQMVLDLVLQYFDTDSEELAAPPGFLIVDSTGCPFVASPFKCTVVKKMLTGTMRKRSDASKRVDNPLAAPSDGFGGAFSGIMAQTDNMFQSFPGAPNTLEAQQLRPLNRTLLFPKRDVGSTIAAGLDIFCFRFTN